MLFVIDCFRSCFDAEARSNEVPVESADVDCGHLTAGGGAV